MHLAVDTATYSIRSFGVFLILAGAIIALAALILGSSPMIWIGSVLIAAGLPLLAVRGWLLRRPASDVRDRMSRTLTLLGLPSVAVEENLSIKMPPLRVDLRPFGTSTMVLFRPAGRFSARERLVIAALIKSQKSIRIII